MRGDKVKIVYSFPTSRLLKGTLSQLILLVLLTDCHTHSHFVVESIIYFFIHSFIRIYFSYILRNCVDGWFSRIEQENKCLYPQNKFVCYKDVAPSLALGQFLTCSNVNTEFWNLECRSLCGSSWLRSNKAYFTYERSTAGLMGQGWHWGSHFTFWYGNKNASDYW